MAVPSVPVFLLVRHSLILLIASLSSEGARSCPELHFRADNGVCRPCSLCSPGIDKADKRVRKGCLISNPDPLPDGGLLWCDDPRGPFPECPPIDPAVVLSSCSEACKAHYQTSFAVGCECTVGCPGQQTQTVRCMEKLQWNSTDIPSACVPEDIVMPVVLGSLVGVVILGITLVIIGTCLCRRLKRKACSSARSEASTHPLMKNRNGCHAGSPEEKIPITVAEQNVTRCADGPIAENGEIVVAVDSSERREMPNSDVTGFRTERDGAQMRDTGEAGEEEEEESFRALQALLKSREDLLQLSKHFDQSCASDQVTWHDVAHHLLGWDVDDVRHTEYICRPLTGSPGDGPMYRVLEAASQQGKGLLDLIACLRQHCNKPASNGTQHTEGVLINFWENWKRRQAFHEELC